jgi:hypothetical protein
MHGRPCRLNIRSPSAALLRQEIDMSTRWKLVTALGLAGAIALSVPSAEARDGRNAAIGFGVVAGALALGAAAAAASQPHYYHGGNHGGPYAHEQPYAYDTYNSYNAPPVYYTPSPYGRRGRPQTPEFLGPP